MKLPYYVVYTDKTPAGDAFMFRVRINPKYKGNEGLMAHEYEHIKQWYLSLLIMLPLCFYMYHQNEVLSYIFLAVTPFMMSFLYNTVAPLRLYLEVKAFRAQAKQKGYPMDFFDWAAGFLAENYNLDITKEEAMKRLRKR